MKNLIFAAKPLALDIGSTLLFVVLSALTHNPLLATAIAIAAGVARVAYVRARGEKISGLQWMSLGLVVVFGAATLLTKDLRFMMAKPTIVYVLVGAAMLQRGWMLPYMPPEAREHVGEITFIRWGYVWAGMMFVTAALNAAFALLASFAVWSVFVTVFPAASKIGLFAVQFLSIRHTAIRQHRARLATAQAAA